ncbi:hypothetical protein M406DRAFT_331474 [Cryphonectria parasitica EP155]|uniref:Uncharacterized protein n=1 Tax=Cryphonectria parasitica (strain ATCC 38755 / EP155) TaxID=660469 RepID=A0A9P4Y2H9_CRYP1|nr:uncharacterized protein M406DRAFT_331474 [Cryphonectria parasitica EP155]KAF3765162.1 hypothetical protein M406DRAFT_331474 [Cryphonectria parasitica EP155]
MSRYTILPESFMAPDPFSPYLRVSFRRPQESRDPIYPASGLQLSFRRASDKYDQEVFLNHRITAADIQHTSAGLCTVLLGRDEVPRYRAHKRRGQQQQQKKQGRGGAAGGGGAMEEEEEEEPEVLVRLHAWRGERHLGAWEVGRLRGRDVFLVMDGDE